MPASLLPFLMQIETIGDAYCVAGGLHKKVDSHAKPIAHMALKMMELSEEVLTPDGKPIKVNFHSFFTRQFFFCVVYTCLMITDRTSISYLSNFVSAFFLLTSWHT